MEDFDVSADGRYVAYVLNEDGRSRLTVLDTLGKVELAPAGLPEGRIGNLRFDRTGRRLAMSVETATAPRDVYVYDLEHGRARALDQQRDRAARCARRWWRRSWCAIPTWDRVAGHAAHAVGVRVPAARRRAPRRW